MIWFAGLLNGRSQPYRVWHRNRVLAREVHCVMKLLREDQNSLWSVSGSPGTTFVYLFIQGLLELLLFIHSFRVSWNCFCSFIHSGSPGTAFVYFFRVLQRFSGHVKHITWVLDSGVQVSYWETSLKVLGTGTAHFDVLRYSVMCCDTVTTPYPGQALRDPHRNSSYWCVAIQCDVLRCSLRRCDTVWCVAIQCDVFRYGVMCCDTVRCVAI